MDKIVVIIPTYNEAANISLMMTALLKEEFPNIKGASMHLLVVDDNSPDGTGELVRKQMKSHKNLHILTGKKEGLGMAYVRGMRYAMDKLNADATVEMDADFQHDPKYLKDLVTAYLEGADYVIGSRYIKGGSIPKAWAWHRKAVSFYGNLFTRAVLFLPNLHDTTTGFRLTRVKGVLDKIDLEHLMELHRFAFKVDLFYQTVKLSKKTVEVPIAFGTRSKETSKFSLKEMIATYKVVLLLRYNASQRLIKFGIVGFTGFMVNFILLRVFRSIGLPEVLAWVLSTEAAILCNFSFNNIWTFKDKTISGFSSILKKLLQFNLTSVGAIIIQSIFGPIGVSIVGAKYDFLVLGFVVAFMVLPYNYFMYSRVIWKKK